MRAARICYTYIENRQYIKLTNKKMSFSVSQFSQLICQNLITRSSFYNPSYSSSVFVLNNKQIFLNIVQNQNEKRPILRLGSFTPSVLYLYSPQRQTMVPLKNDTLRGAIANDKNSKIQMHEAVEKLINSYGW